MVKPTAASILLHILLSHSSRRQISSKWIFLQLASHLQNPNLLNIQTSPVIFDFIFSGLSQDAIVMVSHIKRMKTFS